MTPQAPTHPPGAGGPVGRELERSVRAALASTAVALTGGVVCAQYVGSGLYGYVVPAVLGVLTGAAAPGPRTGAGALRLRAIAAAYAVLGVALGFALERSQGALEAASLLPYGCAVAGVVGWTLPPRTAGDGR